MRGIDAWNSRLARESLDFSQKSMLALAVLKEL
jgi:hypothetical protein